MNDAAVGEAFLTDGVLHHLVVTMGVNADGVISLHGECHCQVQDAFHLPVGGYAMNGGIRAVVLPCTFIDDIVCWVVAASEHKGCYNRITFLNHIAVAA